MLRRVCVLTVVAACFAACGGDDFSGPAGNAGASGSGGDAGSGGNAGQSNGGVGGSSGSGGAAGSSAGSAGSGQGGTAGNPGCVDDHLTFTEDFNDNVVAPSVWQEVENHGIDAFEENGALVVKFPANTPINATGGVETVSQYDLRDCAVFVQITTVPDHADAVVFFGVRSGTRLFEYRIRGGILVGRVCDGDTCSIKAQLGFDPMKHKWLRLREREGAFFWDVAPDGAGWFELKQTAGLFDASAVTIYMGARTEDFALEISSPAGFDNLNVTP